MAVEAFHAAGLRFRAAREVDRGEALFAPETDGRVLSFRKAFLSRRGVLPAALDALLRLGGELWPAPHEMSTAARLASNSFARAAAVA